MFVAWELLSIKRFCQLLHYIDDCIRAHERKQYFAYVKLEKHKHEQIHCWAVRVEANLPGTPLHAQFFIANT